MANAEQIVALTNENIALKKRLQELESYVPTNGKKHAPASFLKNVMSDDFNDGFLNLTSDLICIAGADGYFKYVSPAWTELLGYSAKELLARPFFEFIHPDDRNVTKKEKTVLPSGRVITAFVNRYLHKDGSIHIIGWRATPLPDDPQLIYCIGRDITKYRRAAESVTASEEKFRLLSEKAVVGVYIIQDNKLVYVNPAFANAFGYEPGEIIGKLGPAELTHPDDLPLLASRIRERLSGGMESFSTYYYKGIKKDGSLLYFIVYGAAIDYEGKPAVSGTLIDVTKTKTAEIKLAESQKFMETVLRTTPSAVFTVDLQQRITTWNQMAEKLTGYAAQEVVGRYCHFLSGGENKHDCCLSSREHQKPDFPREIHIPTKDGQDKIILKNSNLLTNENGEVIGGIESFVDITGLKQVEEALRESEEKFTKAFADHPSAMLIVDLKTKKRIDINKSFAALVGYSREELLRQPVGTPSLFADPAALEIVFNKMQNEHQLKDCPLEIVTSAGERRSLLANAAVLDLPHKTLAIASFLDVTEKKATEEKIKASEKRYRTLFELANAGVLLSKDDGQIIEANETFLEMSGYSTADLAALRVRDLFYDDNEREQISAFLEMNREFKNVELRFVTKQKQVKWMNIAVRYIELNGEAFVLSVATDINAAKEAEETRRKLSERIQAGLKAGDIAWWEMELPSGKVIFDDAKATMLGYQANSIKHYRDFMRLLHPDDQEKAMQAMRDHLEGRKEKYEIEYRIKASNGDYQWLRDIGSIAEHDKIAGSFRLVGIVQNITKRKELEEKLVQSHKMEAIGSLAGGVAHDFNNVLTVINGYAQMLALKEPANTFAATALNNIIEAGRKAAALTSQLLAFSRKGIIRPTVFDINYSINEMQKMLLRLVGEDISFNLSLAPTEIKIKVDKGQFEQIILNLVVNAREAMPTGGAIDILSDSVTLDAPLANAFFKVQPGNYARLIVRDNGVGMSAQEQSHIFEPFYTSKRTGTGLGLSTVFGIIKQHDGFVSVKSDQGKGTEFTVLLPLTNEAIVTPKSILDDTISGGSETILVVDDEKNIIELLQKTLSFYGYTVYVAGNAERAIAAYSDSLDKIDLVLTDVIMTEMDGSGLVNYFKTIKNDLKYLFMSGYTDTSILQHNIYIKESELIQKPFSVPVLLKRIRTVLDKG